MESLTNALITLVKIKHKRDKAFNNCEGSWGYFGYNLEEELKKAEEEFDLELNKIIDKRIERSQSCGTT